MDLFSNTTESDQQEVLQLNKTFAKSKINTTAYILLPDYSQLYSFPDWVIAIVILTTRRSEAATHFHFRVLISSEGPGNLQTENRVISTWRTIYRTEAVWKVRSCRCLPRRRTPCRRASGSRAARRRPPASAWRHGAPSWLGGPAGAPTDRLHLTHRWWGVGTGRCMVGVITKKNWINTEGKNGESLSVHREIWQKKSH